MSGTTATGTNTRLSVKTLTSYSAIQLGINAVSTTCLVHLLFFYTDVLRLNPGSAGLVIFLGHLWDGITDPLMGIISDRVRWKGGRRRPFFLPGAVSMGVFYGLLFMPPPSLTERGLFWYMLAAYLAFCTGRTVLDVPYNALLPDLTKHYDERSRLAGWRTGLSLIGDMMGGLFPIVLLITLGQQRLAFTAACGIIATVAVVCGAVGRWGTYEAEAPPPAPPWRDSWRHGLAGSRRPDEDLSSGFVVRLLRTSRAVVRTVLAPVWSLPAAILIVTFGLVVIGTGFPYTVFRYVSKYYFHNPDLDLQIMIAYQAAGVLAAPFWIWTTRRFNKKHTYQAAILGYLAVTLPVLFCRYEDQALFLASMAAAGFCGTGVWMLPSALSPDVIEWHRLHLPNANEGAFYGMWSFTSKFAGGVSPWIVGVTLNYVGWKPDVVQDGTVLLTLLGMFVIYPLIFMGLGAIAFTWYPITREVYADMMHKLGEAAQRDTP